MPKKTPENLTEKRFKASKSLGTFQIDERTGEILKGLIDEKIQFAKLWVNICKSPIEKLLLLVLAWDHADYRRYFDLDDLTLRVQQPVKAEGNSYRIDILITVKTKTGVIKEIAVECDGHEYHERTKEQAKHDKQRDRILKRAGYTVLRYTGHEIYQDPVRCAKDVWKTLETLIS